MPPDARPQDDAAKINDLFQEVTRLKYSLRTLQSLVLYCNDLTRNVQPDILAALAHLVRTMPIEKMDDGLNDVIFQTGLVKQADKGAITLMLDAAGMGVRVRDMDTDDPFPFVLYDVDPASIVNNAETLLAALDPQVQEKFFAWLDAEDEAKYAEREKRGS